MKKRRKRNKKQEIHNLQEPNYNKNINLLSDLSNKIYFHFINLMIIKNIHKKYKNKYLFVIKLYIILSKGNLLKLIGILELILELLNLFCLI